MSRKNPIDGSGAETVKEPTQEPASGKGTTNVDKLAAAAHRAGFVVSAKDGLTYRPCTDPACMDGKVFRVTPMIAQTPDGLSPCPTCSGTSLVLV